ncbi:MAG TPA: cyclase family protein [Thermomicrobiales bacterium]|nr:cyclase family protein [Thermomicrobiales bacterium]
MSNHQSSFIDLSHTVEAGMITYKGLPAPVICDYLSREASREIYAPGTEFQIGRIELVGNTGTYLDSPFHRYADGEDLSEIGLERLADLPVTVVHTSGTTRIGPEFFPAASEIRGHAVLVHTGWSRHWRTDAYFEHYPYLTADAARHLVDSGVALVGIDSYNVDADDDLSRPVHTQVLGAGIPIIEHMTNLEAVPDRGARLYAAPVRFKGVGTFPVRVFVQISSPA